MIITEIQYFSSKIIRFQAIFKDTVEFTCALEFKISSQRNQADTPETDSLCQSIVFIPITIVPDKLSALLLLKKLLETCSYVIC